MGRINRKCCEKIVTNIGDLKVICILVGAEMGKKFALTVSLRDEEGFTW